MLITVGADGDCNCSYLIAQMLFIIFIVVFPLLFIYSFIHFWSDIFSQYSLHLSIVFHRLFFCTKLRMDKRNHLKHQCWNSTFGRSKLIYRWKIRIVLAIHLFLYFYHQIMTPCLKLLCFVSQTSIKWWNKNGKLLKKKQRIN